MGFLARTRIGTQLYPGFGIGILITCLIGAIGPYQMRQINGNVVQFADNWLPSVRRSQCSEATANTERRRVLIPRWTRDLADKRRLADGTTNWSAEAGTGAQGLSGSGSAPRGVSPTDVMRSNCAVLHRMTVCWTVQPRRQRAWTRPGTSPVRAAQGLHRIHQRAGVKGGHQYRWRQCRTNLSPRKSTQPP